MRNRWLIVALIASLAVNLALAGFMVGRMSHQGPAPASLDPTLGMFRMLRELPESRRDVLRPPVREHFRSLRGELRRMRSAQQGINEALTAEPFDADAMSAALERFRGALLDSQQQNHALLVRLATQMSASERQLLRDAMTRGQRPGTHGPRPERPVPR